MSLTYARPPTGSHAEDVALDRPIFTRTASSLQTEVRSLIDELRSKNGVPIVKVLASGRAVEKTLHVDETGLFLVYSPSVRAILDAAVFIPAIAEFRPGCVTDAFRKVTILPDRIPYCFSLMLRSGEKTWNFSFQNGNWALWKNTIEALMRRAWRVLTSYPLKTQLIHLWYNACFYGDERHERQETKRAALSHAPPEAQQQVVTHVEASFTQLMQFGDAFSIPAHVARLVKPFYVDTLASPHYKQLLVSEVDRESASLKSRAGGKDSAASGAGGGGAPAQSSSSSGGASVSGDDGGAAELDGPSFDPLSGNLSARQLRKLKYLNEQTKPFRAFCQFMLEYAFLVPQLFPLFSMYAERPETGALDQSFASPIADEAGIDFSRVEQRAPLLDAMALGGVAEETLARMHMTVHGLARFLADFQHEARSADELHALMRHYQLFDEARLEEQRRAQREESRTGRGVTAAAPGAGSSGATDLNTDPVLTFPQFCQFLLDPLHNGWFKPTHRQVYQDMTQPLCHYFISSSHNTYLTGDQFQSESSTEMYRTSLLKGCRCVELDCWDGDDGFPIIYHGHTRTSKITFESVIRTIDENAFATSPYPVILSLEVHTCPNQQHIMAVNMKNIFREKLLMLSDEEYNRIPHISSSSSSTAPSTAAALLYTPEGLKHRIIVKSKRKVALVAARSPFGNSREDAFEDDIHSSPVGGGGGSGGGGGGRRRRAAAMAAAATRRGDNSDGGKASKKKKKKDNEGDDDDDGESEEDDARDEEDELDAFDTADVVKVTIKKRSRLLLPDVVGMPAHRCSTVAESIRTCQQYHVSSFGENRVAKLIETERSSWTTLNKLMLSRVYPKASRINSSNYHPQPAWNCGAQLVALNFQTLDFPMRLNEAKFEQNGKCGYILKPEYLRKLLKRKRAPSKRREPALAMGGANSSGTTPPLTAAAVTEGPKSRYPGCRVYQLHVRVLAGHLLPKPNLARGGAALSPFVQLLVTGVPEDQSEDGPGDEFVNGTVATRVVERNGMAPVWLQHFTFNVQCIELALLTLRLCDGTLGINKGERKEIAEATIPVPSLRLGYRAVPLRSIASNHELPYSSILCHFALQEL